MEEATAKSPSVSETWEKKNAKFERLFFLL